MILKFAMTCLACMDCLICNSTYEVCNKMYYFFPPDFFQWKNSPVLFSAFQSLFTVKSSVVWTYRRAAECEHQDTYITMLRIDFTCRCFITKQQQFPSTEAPRGWKLNTLLYSLCTHDFTPTHCTQLADDTTGLHVIVMRLFTGMICKATDVVPSITWRLTPPKQNSWSSASADRKRILLHWTKVETMWKMFQL